MSRYWLLLSHDLQCALTSTPLRQAFSVAATETPTYIEEVDIFVMGMLGRLRYSRYFFNGTYRFSVHTSFRSMHEYTHRVVNKIECNLGTYILMYLKIELRVSTVLEGVFVRPIHPQQAREGM